MRIAVAMSGGADSLRAAAILKAEGHRVIGFHMRIQPDSRTNRWNAEEIHAQRQRNLQRLADWLSIPLFFVDLRERFAEQVLTPFIETYRSGLTPNPCVLCNPRIKFGILLEHAIGMGADRFATGHYARILPSEGTTGELRLARGRDRLKDQSYFLFGLTQRQLALTLFPLGDSLKTETTAWSGEIPVESLLSEESQEICFIPHGRYHEFISEQLGDIAPERAGPIVDLEGRAIGRHKGIWAYTIGQRRGLGIASTAPYYVVGIDAGTNTVRVGRVEDLSRRVITVSRINWIAMPPPANAIVCSVKIRNQHVPARAQVTPQGADHVEVRFEQPQRAVTPGQAAVFYDGEIVLGGGVIQP